MDNRISVILNIKKRATNNLNQIKNVRKQTHKIIENTNKVIINNHISIKQTWKEYMLITRWRTPSNLIQRIEMMTLNGIKDIIIPNNNSSIQMKSHISQEYRIKMKNKLSKIGRLHFREAIKMIKIFIHKIKGSFSSRTNNIEVLNNLAKETIKTKMININDQIYVLFIYTNL